MFSEAKNIFSDKSESHLGRIFSLLHISVSEITIYLNKCKTKSTRSFNDWSVE